MRYGKGTEKPNASRVAKKTTDGEAAQPTFPKMSELAQAAARNLWFTPQALPKKELNCAEGGKDAIAGVDKEGLSDGKGRGP